jgi:hypothetical protein
MRPAFVIGNGRSRVGFDIRRLNVAGVTYGTNALFRDHPVNYLVCADRTMLKEAHTSNVQNISFLYSRARWLEGNNDPSLQVVPDLPYLGPNKADKAEHWGSGHYASLLACQKNHEIIIHLGFDLWGNAHNEQNNVYSNTHGYKDKKEDAVDPKFWIYHSAKLFEHYPEIQHVYINKEDWKVPDEWKEYSNFSLDTYQGLEDFLVDYPV